MFAAGRKMAALLLVLLLLLLGVPSALASGVTVNMTQNATLGTILTDSAGKVLYRFTRDTINTSSACYNQCATAWPPLLIDEGRIYVARPPLYKITEKKNVRFVQTAEEMHKELIARGLKNAALVILPRGEGEPRRLAGDELMALLNVLTPLEGAVQLLERRQASLSQREQRDVARHLVREKKLDEAYLQWAQEVRGRAFVEYREPPQ